MQDEEGRKCVTIFWVWQKEMWELNVYTARAGFMGKCDVGESDLGEGNIMKKPLTNGFGGMTDWGVSR